MIPISIMSTKKAMLFIVTFLMKALIAKHIRELMLILIKILMPKSIEPLIQKNSMTGVHLVHIRSSSLLMKSAITGSIGYGKEKRECLTVMIIA